MLLADNAADAPLKNPFPVPTTRESFLAWQRSNTAAARIQEGEHDPLFRHSDAYDKAVQISQRGTVKAAALMLSEEYPQIQRLVIEENEDGERQLDVVALEGELGRPIVFSDTSPGDIELGDGAMTLADVGYFFVNENGSWIGDVASHDVVGYDTRRISIDLTKAAQMDLDATPERVAPVPGEEDWDEEDLDGLHPDED
ncbi:hypothetical protein [Kocuria sp. CH-021]|uniref:hypothetical protein n=1 Tax=Kocuria sp. CH-021 TaxID=3406735 RepID=UPI003C7900EF